MVWTRHFTFVGKNERLNKSLKQGTDSNWFGTSDSGSAKSGKYSSYLPEYYAGNPQRLERYKSYDNMDMDSEVNGSLDVIADFSTQTEEHKDTPFDLEFMGEVSETEVQILNSALRQWSRMNEFNKRIWSIFRNVIKYGDCFFVRDPETFKWLYVDQNKIQAIVVNAAKGKIPEEYIINGIDFKIDPSVLTDTTKATNAIAQSAPSAAASPVSQTNASYGTGNNGIGETVGVQADSIVHLSLSQGMDGNWPFGNSVLESVFKVYKQKELLEDSIIIYRVQRAPERRVFYIDVGEMATHKAMAFVERIKNEIHQKRIPNRNGGGNNILDAAYNPLSMIEDYFFAQTPDGRGSKVETLPGGENLGEIDDLKYFDNKLKRGLGVPSSYLPSGPEDGGTPYTDGKVGTAYMQEYRFAQYCKRLQMLISDKFDREFKLYLKKRGFNVDSGLFELRLCEPQSFSKYRQIEIDSAQINIFQPLSEVPYLSKRFLLQRYLNLDEDEILENEKLWKEENKNKVKPDNEGGAGGMGAMGGGDIGLDSVGVRPPVDFEDDMGGDMDAGAEDAGADVNASPIGGTAPDPGAPV